MKRMCTWISVALIAIGVAVVGSGLSLTDMPNDGAYGNQVKAILNANWVLLETMLAMTGDGTLSDAGVFALAADTVGTAEMADADHGDISWASGVASVEGMDNDIVTSVHLGDDDWGDGSVASGIFSLDTGVVGYDELGVATVVSKVSYGIPVVIRFEPTVGETINYLVPTAYDLLITAAYGYKAGAAGDNAADQWDLQNAALGSIFDILELNGITDESYLTFDNLDDSRDEVEGATTLILVAGEDTDDDGADGIIIVEGLFKTAD